MTSATIYMSSSSLACPIKRDDEFNFSERFEKYITQLTSIRDNLKSKLFRIILSRNTGEILIELDLYPIYPAIETGLNQSELNEIYQTGDIAKIVEQVLRDSRFVEDIIGVADTLIDHITLKGPIEYFDKVADRQKQNKAILAYGKHLGILGNRPIWVIGSEPVGGIDGSQSSDLHVTAEVAFVEWAGKEKSKDLPATINCTFPFSYSFDHVRRSTTHTCEMQDFPLGAMKEWISCALLNEELTGGRAEIHDWKVGAEFEKSIADLHLHMNPSVFKSIIAACVNVICEIALDKTHPLRNGKGGNCPQIIQKGFSAWRRDINYEFHLHYWVKGRFCEFASCVVHEDFTIPAPP